MLGKYLAIPRTFFCLCLKSILLHLFSTNLHFDLLSFTNTTILPITSMICPSPFLELIV